MTKFERGHTYAGRMIVHYDTIVTAHIVDRTEKTIKARINNEATAKTFRVKVYNNTEYFYPQGKHSMATVIRAEKRIS